MSIDFPREEERVLARWKEIDAFLRQVELVSGCDFLRPFPTYFTCPSVGLSVVILSCYSYIA